VRQLQRASPFLEQERAEVRTTVVLTARMWLVGSQIAVSVLHISISAKTPRDVRGHGRASAHEPTLVSETVRSSRDLLSCSPAIAMRASCERAAFRSKWLDVHRCTRNNCEPTTIVMLQRVLVSSSRQLNQFE
jgi:hypothetical protein